MINMLKVLMENRHERQMDNLSREVEILRKNQNKMLEIKQHYNKKGKCLYMHIGRVDTAKETISKLVHISTETSKTKV